jgi:hypothetical protein
MYFLHRIENHQDNTKYYTDEKIKDIKKDIVKIIPKTLAMEKLINEIKNQIGIDTPKQIVRNDMYYIVEFGYIFTVDYIKQFVKELKEIKETISSDLLIDVFDILIDNYKDFKGDE